MADIRIGSIVKAHYRSGTYIGEVKEDRGDRYLIEVRAVLKHPLQGDLHNMKQTENVFFHERKALAYHEKMNVKKPAVHAYEEDIPHYNESLKIAVGAYRDKLEKEATAYSEKALNVLNHLENEVYLKLYSQI